MAFDAEKPLQWIYQSITNKYDENEIPQSPRCRRLRFFESVHDFRTKYRYNNLMYGVAQHVAEVIGGKSWEQLTEEFLFRPIGMTSSTFVHKSRERWHEFATPYLLYNQTLRPVSLEAHT